MKDYFERLNVEQKQAVEHVKGACMVLAGPGTGKTTIITSRICNLLDKEGIAPESILVVTFSKAAADEMKQRFNSIYKGKSDLSNISFGTFHSIFFKILKKYKGYKLENLIDEKQRFNIIKTLINKLGIGNPDDEQQIIDIIKELGFVLNTMADIDSFEPESCKQKDFKTILESYCDYKSKTDKFDYDDMLLDCYYLLNSNIRVLKEIREKFKYILIDEFQDINTVQFETIKLMAEPLNNIFCVGDDDQSIYGFRGAAPSILMEFEKLYPACSKVFLSKNYRTTKNILMSAQFLISNNTERYAKNIVSVLDYGNTSVLLNPEDFEQEGKLIAAKIVDIK